MKPQTFVSGVLAIMITSAVSATSAKATSVVSLDGEWMLAPDPQNVGIGQTWWTQPRTDAKPTKVPWIIQDAFPGYHGVAWYWRDFEGPKNPNPGGRTLLRFWAVDYKADVWLNGISVGSHQGGESPFVLDVTDAIKPGAANRLAVRVLNPTHTPIDGIVLNETPHRNKALPYSSGSAWDQGGIIDSVEVLLAPAVRIEDLFVRPDPKTGLLQIQTNVRNASGKPVSGKLTFVIGPAASGETIAVASQQRDLPGGDTLVETSLKVDKPRLWELNDPYLYRVTARVCVSPSSSASDAMAMDEFSVRCGFRDFSFQAGAFRLNGKRLFLRCSHTGNCCPIGLEMPHDPDLLRRDLINSKMMGFNSIRFIAGVPKRYQLDLADEIGLMVYEESYAGWCLADSPKMAERYDESVFGMIRRDRNHPSVTMWGLLNETSDGPVFRHAVSVLPKVRELDDSRLVMLNSGRFDNAGGASIAGIEVWRNAGREDPCVTRNSTDHVIRALGITWQPGQLAFHPGRNGEYAVVRWTAPSTGKAEFSVVFHSIAERATTDIHVLHNAKRLFDGFINVQSHGPESKFASILEVKDGDTVDCVVGYGNGDYGADTTALAVVVTSAGKTYDAAKDFNLEKNPNGVWSYGQMAPAASPSVATFAQFARAKKEESVGTLSNPHTSTWQDVLQDTHPYRHVPHTADVIRELRTIGGAQPVFISECGIGSAVDLMRVVRLYEQLGKAEVEDAQFYRTQRDRYLVDWKRWKMAECFARPEDFFIQSNTRMAGQRLLVLNAIRSNPHVVGHSITGTVDQGMTAEGLWTTFRELKPGTTDAIFDGWAPLRWCLFVEPVNVYRKTPVHLEAVLANEDVLMPAEYPVRLQVIGPNVTRVFEKKLTVKVPDPHAKPEPGFVLPVFAGDAVIDGPAGAYRFIATFERGAAAAGGDVEFYVDVESSAMPAVNREVVLCGQDAVLGKWLSDRAITVRPWSADEKPASAAVILVSGKLPGPNDAAVLGRLADQIAGGAMVILLTPEAVTKADQVASWAPLKIKGHLTGISRWLYHADDWAKRHPIFDGLPCGGLMDYTFYREIIPDLVWAGEGAPDEVVAAAINASQAYQSGLLLAVYAQGKGRLIVNTLKIRENLGRQPAAERLLRNMLRYASGVSHSR